MLERGLGKKGRDWIYERFTDEQTYMDDDSNTECDGRGLLV